MPLDGYFVGLLVAISAITGSAAVVGGNVTAFEEKDAKNISGDGLNAMLHAVRKRQTEESDYWTDYMTGEKLDWNGMDSSEISSSKEIPLYTVNKEGILNFNTGFPYGPTRTVRLHFRDEDTCSAAGHNGIFFTINICQGGTSSTGTCPGGIAACFPGRLDPRNKPDVEQSFALPNVNEEVAKVCNDSSIRQKWVEWKHFPEIHTLLFSSVDRKYLKIQVSYLKQGTGSSVFPMKTDGRDSEMIEFGSDGCVQFWIGTVEDGLYGKIVSNQKDKEEKLKPVVIQQSKAEFWRLRSNGVPLRQMPLASSLPPNIFVGTNGGAVPIMAFVTSEQCDFTVKITGSNLRKCLDRECKNEIKGMESHYSEHVSALKPIFKKDDVPAKYYGSIFIELDEQGKPETILNIQGNDVYFTVATKTREPPVLFLRYPLEPNGKCLEKEYFRSNEFVLAYNGRPDCKTSFGWAEGKLRFQDFQGNTKIVAGTGGFPLHIGADEFWVQEENGEKVVLGHGQCTIKPRMTREAFEGIPEHKYLWDFIVNPTVNNNAWQSLCPLALSINMADYRLLLPESAF